jgi:four helix bundle protein
MSYQDLEIWRRSSELVVLIHEMTLKDLPGFEKHEVGSQIRQSIKSVKSNIVEGYGRRSYKNDYVRFLVIAQASLDESIDHLDTLYLTKSLMDVKKYRELKEKLGTLGRMLNVFIQAIRKR